jgi:DNA-binding transcriptional LysR family regulator
MTPELRLIRYFVVVAETGNVTRAAARLHIAQPSLSAAIKQLEAQLGVELLKREGRGVALTPAGELLYRRGRELVAAADALAAELRGAATSARLRLGVTPAARYGVAPRLLSACAAEAPGVMLYTSEDTTGALLRGVASGVLDAAVVFCAPADRPANLVFHNLWEERAVVHLPADHRLATRERVTLADLAGERILVASSPDSSGYTTRIVGAFEREGVEPRTVSDPYPDLGLQAVREGFGVVIYARSAYPDDLEGSAFVTLAPPVALPFELVVHARAVSPATAAVVAAAKAVAGAEAETVLG